MGLSAEELDEIRSLADRSKGILGELRTKAGEADLQRKQELERFGVDASQLVERVAVQIANELASELASKQQDSEAEQEQFQRERDAWRQECAEWEQVRQQVEAELAQKEEQLQANAQQTATEGVARERDKILAEVADREKETAERLASFEQERNNYAAALQEANQRLERAQAVESENAELKEKLEKMLHDLGEHREHVARLEGDLAARPETNDTDSAELLQLRQERDELARQLELARTTPGEGADSEQLADLTRRFELAVEDVRALKTENAELQQKLSASESSPGAASGADENDWEAQKRKLLASLEGEGDPDPADQPQRAEERATIEGTIQITDGVVAEKQREIEELKQQLADQPAGAEPGIDAETAAATAALIDEDAVVQAERDRLAQLEKEMEEKLRSAELELSMERAKIARAQSKLEEQQLELETLRKSPGENTNQSSAGADTKRKWFDKLGLGGNEGE